MGIARGSGTDASTGTGSRVHLLVLAALAYVPILLTETFRVSADTKSYLTIDPARLLSGAWAMWDPSVGAGTVTHQNIGFLFPLGPVYLVADALAIPDGITQRLIWGTVVFAAAAGTYRVARWLGWAGSAAFVAAVAYAWSPYLLAYLARLSVILFPFAALPWLVLFAARAVREGGWRSPARFALVVGLVGSVNATSLVLVGLGPVVWVLVEWVGGRHRRAAVVGATARTLALTIPVSLWWIVALRVQGAYGLPILRYTETYHAVAGSSTPPEILRGLGYWFFYGGDRLGPWVGPSERYVHPVMIGIGAIVVVISLIGLTLGFRGRRRALALVMVGLTISVGAAPLGAAPWFGRAFEWFATSTTAGFALRSTPRAVPVLVLGLALGFAAATSHLAARVPSRPLLGARLRPATVVSAGAVLLVALQLHPWFTGASLTGSLLRDETLPTHRLDLAEHLDASGTARVYELPGADFASHRWGGTVDPSLPGMIDRSYLARELVPQGSPGTADLLGAFERRMHEGWFEPSSLVPVAERFGIGTVVVRNDLEHERYRLARPTQLWPRLLDALGTPDHLGPIVADTPAIPMLDELALADGRAVEEFPVVAAWDLDADRSIWSWTPDSPMVVAGSGDGIVDLAAVGLLDHDRPVIYAGTLVDPTIPHVDLGDDPWFVVTDTNRRRGHRWSTLGANRGALEQAGATPVRDDPGDNRLDLFIDDDALRTVLALDGDLASVQATGYGNRIAYTPEDAPRFAFDGDPNTAWRTGVFDDIRAERIEAVLDQPVAADHLVLLQPVTGVTDRTLTRVRVHLDDHTTLEVDLDDRSRAVPGQRVEIPTTAFTRLTIELVADNRGPLSSYAGQPGVGFAEVTIPGVSVEAEAVVPTGWLDAVTSDGVELDRHRLDVVLTRERIDPATPNRTDPEPQLARRVDLPTDRSFEVSGQARLSAAADDTTLAVALGENPVVIANRRLPGSPAARARSAIDGDETTAWRTPFDAAVGSRLELALGPSIATAEIRMQWPADDAHAPPTEIAVTADHDPTTTVVVPVEHRDAATGEAVLSVPIEAEHLGIEILSVRPVTTPEYFSGAERTVPTAIAELVLVAADGTEIRPWPVVDPNLPLDARCREDLVSIDGIPIAIRLDGTVGDALQRRPIAIVGCEPTALRTGANRIRTASGAMTGFDVDRLVLTSPATPTATTERATTTEPSGDVTVLGRRPGPTSVELELPVSADAGWLVFRESWNPGWELRIDGVDAGPALLVDGYANGWHLPAAASPRTATLHWTPQRTVTIAIWASAVAGLLVACIAFARIRAIGIDAVGAPTSAMRAASATVVMAVGLGVAGGPAALLGAVGARLLRDRRIRGTSAVRLLVVALWFAAIGPVAALQLRNGFPADPDWPSRFTAAAPLTWAAIGAVAMSRPIRMASLRRPGIEEPSSRSE